MSGHTHTAFCFLFFTPISCSPGPRTPPHLPLQISTQIFSRLWILLCSGRGDGLRWLGLRSFDTNALSLWQHSASAEGALALLQGRILLRWPRGQLGPIQCPVPCPQLPNSFTSLILPLLSCPGKGTEVREREAEERTLGRYKPPRLSVGWKLFSWTEQKCTGLPDKKKTQKLPTGTTVQVLMY